MFSTGEQIMYGGTGVCTVVDIGTPDYAGADRECYILEPRYVKNARIYAPIGTTPVKMRPLLTDAQALELIDRMPALAALPCGRERQELVNICRSTIKGADSRQLARLLKTLHQRRARAQEQKRTVSSMEKELYDTAEHLLYGELAAVLGLPVAGVGDFIAGRLGRDALGKAEAS